MSKIFEALQQAGYTVRNVDLTPVIEDGTGRRTVHNMEAPAARTADPTPLPNIRIASLRLSHAAAVAPFDHKQPRAGEQYRVLRTRIVQHPLKPRIVLVSSAGPGDGKSTTAMNLAFALALRSDVKILLVSADMRRDTIAPELGLNRSPGLAEFLNGECLLNEAIVQCEQLSNLDILPAGNWNSNPCELLDSELWRSTCNLMRERYGFIVLDSPPIGAVADYDLLQSVADGVLLIVQPGKTRRDLALAALRTIPKSKFLGVVVNCLSGWFAEEERLYDRYYLFRAVVRKAEQQQSDHRP